MNDAKIRNIAVCVFDAYGTLFDFNSAAARHRDALGGKAEQLSAIWRDKQLQYTWLRSLMQIYAPFWSVTGEALDYAMDTVGIDDDVLRDKLMQAYRNIEAFDEVPGVLGTLKDAGMRTAILSNGSPEMLQAGMTASGLDDLLDDCLSVDDIGIYKPDPAVYRMVCERFDVKPGEVCFQSSNAWDAAGAAAFGFRVVWINRYGQKPERLPAAPDFEGKTLNDLPPLLGL